MPILTDYDLILQKTEDAYTAETVATVVGSPSIEGDTVTFGVKGGGVFIVNSRNYHVITTSPRSY